MQNLQKLFVLPVVSAGVLAIVASAYGAQSTGRAAYNVTNVNRSGMSASTRMPTMPSLPINSVGNLSPNLPSNNGGNNGGGDPDPEPNPDPQPECPDGGVKNSEYTVERCMNDVLNCINNGALQGGLNDLFNEDLRNAIENGMGLCSVQVEKCVTEVRQDCANVYRSSADVWIDFNSRKVQPEYYNFVLRKTGLTPNQAENTCWLLDKNTYGSSFNAVSNNGTVTAEYNNRVGAYNNQSGNVLIKNQPQGVTVNDNNSGVDGQRGHYARWDATTADCWIRVGAYNKDDHIKNSWLFGAAGDDEPAEVWRAAGDTFSCNKDLFGFSLMNQTSTAAVVGVGGGTVLGVGVGAIAGHGKRAFDCDNAKHREMLTEDIRANGAMGVLNEYLESDYRIGTTTKVMNVDQCNAVVNLYDSYGAVASALTACSGKEVEVKESSTVNIHIKYNSATDGSLDNFFANNIPVCLTYTDVNSCANRLATDCVSQNLNGEQCVDYWVNQHGVNANVVSGASETQIVGGECTFKPLNKAREFGETIYCEATAGCIDAKTAQDDIKRLKRVFDDDIINLINNGEKSNMGKAIGIGAAAGAGAGGLATAITAFVERSNINCRVGDGLAQVGFGKSYSIGSLKDFYVKWNLRLPDTVAPTALVTDCDSWKHTCAAYNDMSQCKNAQINYKPVDATETKLIRSACKVSGSVCIENYPVAKSHGACK